MVRIEWELIEKRLNGGMTAEESEHLENWCAEKEENRAYLQKIIAFHTAGKEVEEVTDKAVALSWDKFQGTLKRQKKIGRRRILYWTSSVAACLLIGVLAVVLKYRTETGYVPLRTHIVAGSAKAILTTSSGEQFELAEDSCTITDASAKIVNQGKTLNYVVQKDMSLELSACNQVTTPRGGEYNVVLPDGSRVYLGALSTLKFPLVFGSQARTVEVSGEAYFDVVYDPRHPFIVKMERIEVEVLGTSFNIRDYDDESFIETTLVNGKVKIRAAGDSCVLVPDEQAVFDRKTDGLSVRKVDVTEYVDWKEGRLNIRNQRLEEILLRLGKWYDIQVFFVHEGAKDVRFYANIDRYSDLDELLDKFEKTGEVEFEVKGNTVTVRQVGK